MIDRAVVVVIAVAVVVAVVVVRAKPRCVKQKNPCRHCETNCQ
jgi:hypothetical protein